MPKLLPVLMLSLLTFVICFNQDQKYHETIAKFFSEFFEHGKTCESWSQAFNPDGIFYHPANPSGARGHRALIAFCSSTTKDFPRRISKFTPRGDLPLLTRSYGSTWATVPYVFGGINNGQQFLNFGHLTFEFDSNAKILKAVETWENKKWK